MALGLKTITTRNLALAWRSLQLLLTLMPRINTHFSALLKPAIVEKNIEQVMQRNVTHASFFYVLLSCYVPLQHIICVLHLSTNDLLMISPTTVKNIEHIIKNMEKLSYDTPPSFLP